jgi:hypothetical protein
MMAIGTLARKLMANRSWEKERPVATMAESSQDWGGIAFNVPMANNVRRVGRSANALDLGAQSQRVDVRRVQYVFGTEVSHNVKFPRATT